jgi:hypothetical protein
MKRLSSSQFGALVGALTGAVARFAVTASCIGSLSQGRWLHSDDGLALALILGIVSAFLGVIVGGVAGATCNPARGSLLGAVLSAGFFLGLCVLPGELAMGYSGQSGFTWEGWNRNRDEGLMLLLGIIPMTVAGAIAGGAGAFVGSRRRTTERERAFDDIDFAQPVSPAGSARKPEPRPEFRCPRCGTAERPSTLSAVSVGGWVVLASMLVVCFPLFWVGLLIREKQSVCAVCGLTMH